MTDSLPPCTCGHGAGRHACLEYVGGGLRLFECAVGGCGCRWYQPSAEDNRHSHADHTPGQEGHRECVQDNEKQDQEQDQGRHDDAEPGGPLELHESL